MFSSVKRTLFILLVVCEVIILAGCEPGQNWAKFTITNISQYTVEIPEHFWDDGETILLPGAVNTVCHWWFDNEDEFIEGFKYTINGEVVENYNIPLHHKEHVTVIIKDPGLDGYEIHRETNIKM